MQPSPCRAAAFVLLLCCYLARGAAATGTPLYRKYVIEFNGQFTALRAEPDDVAGLVPKVKAMIADRADALNLDLKAAELTRVEIGQNAANGRITAIVHVSDNVSESVYQQVGEKCDKNTCTLTGVYQGPKQFSSQDVPVASLKRTVILPTSSPTTSPTLSPSMTPSAAPTHRPTMAPVQPTGSPTGRPTPAFGGAAPGVRDGTVVVVIGIVIATILFACWLHRFFHWFCAYEKGKHNKFLTPEPVVLDGSNDMFMRHQNEALPEYCTNKSRGMQEAVVSALLKPPKEPLNAMARMKAKAAAAKGHVHKTHTAEEIKQHKMRKAARAVRAAAAAHKAANAFKKPLKHDEVELEEHNP